MKKNTKLFSSIIIFGLLFFTNQINIYADTIYVGGATPDYTTIQEAIDNAIEDDVIIVAEGTYNEDLEFFGENIVLQSTDPLNSSVVENTIIQGTGTTSVITLDGSESPDCEIKGFTITGGHADFGGGGIAGNASLTSISHNIIFGNSAGVIYGHGGGIFNCDGTIAFNTISNNSVLNGGGGLSACDGIILYNTITGNYTSVPEAGYGGGFSECGGTIANNNISNNSAGIAGGGLYFCSGTILHNFINENSAVNDGGGLNDCDGVISNNIISNNSAGNFAGGIAFCNGTIKNNTIVNNSAVYLAGGLYYCTTSIVNNIIWGNTADSAPQIYNSSIPTYCCIQDWTEGGEGNISDNPQFVDYNHGNYHLKAISPCIDSGDSSYANPGDIDYDGLPRLADGDNNGTDIVDMGAYEYVYGTFLTIKDWMLY